MKKIFLMFIMILSVSSVFSAPPFEEWPDSEKEIVYNNRLRKYGLYDVDGIDFDVKVELVKRLDERHNKELRYYKELLAGGEGKITTDYDIRMIKSLGLFNIRFVDQKSDLPESIQKGFEAIRKIDRKPINKKDENMLKFYKSKGENVLFLSFEDLKALPEYQAYQKACKIKNEIKNIKAKGYLKIDENTGDIYTFYDFEKVEALENELNELNIDFKVVKAYENNHYFVFLGE